MIVVPVVSFVSLVKSALAFASLMQPRCRSPCVKACVRSRISASSNPLQGAGVGALALEGFCEGITERVLRGPLRVSGAPGW